MTFIDKNKRSQWEKSKREEYKNKYKARHRANEIYKKAQTCSIKNCKDIGQRHHADYKKPENIVWLCEHHHKQLHRKYPNECRIETCVKQHHSKGYCKLHYNRWKRQNRDYYLKELKMNRLYKERMMTARNPL